MMIKGINNKEQSIIRSILNEYTSKYDFFYYGSRVKGNFRVLSDLDILIKSDSKVSLDDLETLKMLFDNSNLPYVVNLVDYNNIDKDFYNLIKNDLVKAV